ncbi:MAG TPA: hypothetical protein VGI03_03760 [Verrucomicrobiae bacterium]|jgi:hypothetical protein
MKKLIPLLVVPLFLAGCGNNNTNPGADTNAPAASEMNTNAAVPGGATMGTNMDTNTPPSMPDTNMPANSPTNSPP